MGEELSDSREDIVEFLKRDVLRNIILLKMLAAYPNDIRAFTCEDGAVSGANKSVLLLLPTRASPFDRKMYPNTEFVVMFSAVQPEAVTSLTALLIEQLLAHLPNECGLVFKFIDEGQREIVRQRLALRRATAFRSFTARPGSRYAPIEGVQISDQVLPGCYELYARQGYERAEIAEYFGTRQGRSFAIYEGSAPVAACMTFPNYANVYEIGAVHTLPEKRRHGLAQRVVITALSVVLQNGWIPRYQVHEDNLPSINLAQSIGLEQFVMVEHWVYPA
jgi:predicted GNAT family acetyltransferase